MQKAASEHQAQKKPIIGVDCRLAGARHAGIGRYILNVAQRLPKATSSFQFVYFVSDLQQQKELESEGRLAVSWKITPWRHYSLNEQLFMPRALSLQKLDLLHVPHFNAPLFYTGKLIVTIHDLLWHEYKGITVTTLPSWQYWLKYRAYQLVVASTIQRATTILVPSQTVKKTLLKFYPRAQKKVIVTLEGISLAAPISEILPLKTKQLIYVGSLYPHKNVGCILEALRLLPNYNLVIVGARNAFVDRFKSQVELLGLSKQVDFKGYVSDSKLESLIASSLALIQPSFSEGFGLTGLEAMAAGGVVLASDIPIFHEVYGTAALYFNPKKPKELAQQITSLTINKRQQLKRKALQQLQQFSWEKTVTATLEQYHHILS